MKINTAMSGPLNVSIFEEQRGRRLGGVGRYIREIVSHTNRLNSNVKLRVLRQGRELSVNEQLFKDPGTPGLFPLIDKAATKIRRRLWHRRSLSHAIHYPYGYLPENWNKGSQKKIITIHGAARFSGASWVLPQGRRTGEIFSTRFHDHREAISRIITVSEFSKNEIITVFGVKPETVSVIPNGVDLINFRPIDKKNAFFELNAALGINSPFILHLGSATPRKNVLSLIQAFRWLKGQGSFPFKLILSGPKGPLTQHIKRKINELNLDGDVIVTGAVCNDTLIKLYNAASVFVFPSLYEGFGMPVLEAMACGTPVITSKCSALPETVGDAALLIDDPINFKQIAENIQTVIGDVHYQAVLKQKGLTRVKKFTWQRSAKAHLDLYKEVAFDLNG